MGGSLLSSAENHDKTNKNIEGVQVDSQRLVDWVEALSGFSFLHDALGSIQGHSSEEGKSSIQPDICEHLRLHEHRQETDAHHSSETDGERTTPV